MFTSNEVFSRERLAGYDPDCLSDSTVLVVGVGALGQNTAQNLALAGVGEIRIVDKDVFEDHNRTRSPAYPLPDEKEELGMGKARAVAHKLKRIMTASRPVMRYAENWIQEIGDGAFKGVSAVVSCVDTLKGRAYLSDKARLHAIPFIEGGFDGSFVSLSCYPGARLERARLAPCWRCSHPKLIDGISCAEYARLAEKAGIIPALQNSAATLAGLQAEATIIALHGEKIAPAEFIAFDLDIRNFRAQVVRLAADPQCKGLHRSMDEEPVALQTSADDTVERLLQEVSQRLNGDPTVELFLPLIWTAPCVNCKRRTLVMKPTWLWQMNARCEDCDGPFQIIGNGGAARSPWLITQLRTGMTQAIREATCRQVGLPPLSIVEARVDGGQSGFFELAGSIDELF